MGGKGGQTPIKRINGKVRKGGQTLRKGGQTPIKNNGGQTPIK